MKSKNPKYTTPYKNIKPAEAAFAEEVPNLNGQVLDRVRLFRAFAPLFPGSSGTIDIGSADKRFRKAYFTQSVSVVSDRDLKKNITDLKYGRKEILKMRPVQYQLKRGRRKQNFGEGDDVMLGLVAQEVQKIIPELVDASGEFLSITYDEIIPILIAAFKEESALNTAFHEFMLKKIAALEKECAKLTKAQGTK